MSLQRVRRERTDQSVITKDDNLEESWQVTVCFPQAQLTMDSKISSCRFRFVCWKWMYVDNSCIVIFHVGAPKGAIFCYEIFKVAPLVLSLAHALQVDTVVPLHAAFKKVSHQQALSSVFFFSVKYTWGCLHTGSSWQEPLTADTKYSSLSENWSRERRCLRVQMVWTFVKVWTWGL